MIPMVTEDDQDGKPGAPSVEVTAGRAAAERQRGPRRADSEAPVGTTARTPADDAAAPTATSLAGQDCARTDDLRAVPLFDSLSDANLASLARTVQKRHAAESDVLCREGERGDEMYVILQGAVTLQKYVDERDTQLGRLESGAYFGEMALIGEMRPQRDHPRRDRPRLPGHRSRHAYGGHLGVPDRRAPDPARLQRAAGQHHRASRPTERPSERRPRRGRPARRRSIRTSSFAQILEQLVQVAPHPLAVLARRLLVEDRVEPQGAAGARRATS